MNLLTDNECRDIYNGAMAMPERSVVQTMRVIEAAQRGVDNAEISARRRDGLPC